MDTPLNSYLASLDSPRRPLTQELIEELHARYPFFTLPALTALQQARDGVIELSPEVRQQLMARVALNSCDSTMLFRLLDPTGRQFNRFYENTDKPRTPSTDSAIDTFLTTFGKIDPAEEALLERLIFNPVPDYSSVLAADAGATPPRSADAQDALLDAFLAGQQAAPPREPQRETEPPRPSAPVVSSTPDEPLTESLAKIYIKQQRYEKAFEIIQQLSLNNPKKSAYFADQLRFLQKLILNCQLADSKTDKKKIKS